MKYAGNYYKKLNKLAKTRCNLNYLCWDIEKWQNEIRFKRKSPNTSDIMIDKTVQWNENNFNKMKDIFNEFNKEMIDVAKQKGMAKYYDKNKDFFDGISKVDLENTKINWNGIYATYKRKVSEISENECELANYAVELCYNLYPNKSKSFCWVVTEEGLLKNIEANSDRIVFEIFETGDNRDTEYMGRYYRMEELFNV